jgi:hypothetical protein
LTTSGLCFSLPFLNRIGSASVQIGGAAGTFSTLRS